MLSELWVSAVHNKGPGKMKDIIRHELIGLEIEVTASKNKSLVGVKGKIVDETKNTLKVRANSRVLTIMKNAIMFKANVGGKNIEIDGKCLMARPEDRIKK